MVFFIGGTAKVLDLPKKLNIMEGKMAIVKNITGSEGKYKEPQTLGFKDDDGIIHFLKAGETVECNYTRSMSSRLMILPNEEKVEDKKKKKGKEV